MRIQEHTYGAYHWMHYWFLAFVLLLAGWSWSVVPGTGSSTVRVLYLHLAQSLGSVTLGTENR